MEGWQEYQFDNEGLDENCLLLNMDVEKLDTQIPSKCQYIIEKIYIGLKMFMYL